jgi:intracellular multiplication protein IcmB
MAGLIDPILDSVDTLLAWFSSGLATTIASNCDIQTADGPVSLVTNDGSLCTVMRVEGVSSVVGPEEFKSIHKGIVEAFSPFMSIDGHGLQVVFTYSKERIHEVLADNYAESRNTCKTLKLDLNDLLDERLVNMARWCAYEAVYVVVWTKVESLTREQQKAAMAKKSEQYKAENMPVFRYTQNIVAAIPDLRDSHETNIKTVITTAKTHGLKIVTLDVHSAVYAIRREVDLEFTDKNWGAILPGDRIRPKLAQSFTGDVADILWPSLVKQIFPRDAFNRTFDSVQVGNMIYAGVYIDLFPRDIQPFNALLSRTLQSAIPWRMSFLLESGGLQTVRMKKALAVILSFSSAQNRLIADGIDLLSYIDLNTDDTIVSLKVCATTWAPETDMALLKVRHSILARAIQGWGTCDVSQFCGDAFSGFVSTVPAISTKSVSTSTAASLADAICMLPLFRPTSPWDKGALLFRSPDGKLWPYQPGSPIQTTCIDLFFARPGSGKSVLSNATNLALCLMGGLKRLPRISIIDIGPSSSGLISLLKEALPMSQRSQAAYYRLQMTEEYSINPFDTQLGSRLPMPLERSFLVNFIALLTTPVGENKPYDGMVDMIGLVVDEAYKSFMNENSPNVYTQASEPEIDDILKDINFVPDEKTSWWEVTDALFLAGCISEAQAAQRHAVPLLSDLASIARTTAVQDLYGKVTTPTGENLITAFTRMISSSVREYPVLSRVTKFDIGDARVVSLDLDEVAKAGGVAADRQTAVMYMLARYVLTKDFYLNVASMSKASEAYKSYHEKRAAEAQEDPKRLVMDEFHRTSHAQAVRDQVVVDMREGRKWRVQVALLSQSLDDFDSVMIDFATSVFILDAGPEQAIQKAKKVFGLKGSAESALRDYVRGPSDQGATMLGQFSTKQGTTTQLITLTLGPIEIWALSTTSEDYLLRNYLYKRLGPSETRRVLARIFPSGSAAKFLLKRAQRAEDDGVKLDEDQKTGMVEQLAKEIISQYRKDPQFKEIVV